MKQTLSEQTRADQDVLALLTHAFTLYMEGDPVGARLAAQMAAPAVPVSGPAQAALGDRLLAIDDHQGAEDALRIACDMGACDAGTLIRLAQSQRAQGRLDDAADTLRRAIVDQPASVEAYLNLGICQSARQHHRASARSLRRAACLSPYNASIRLLLGNAEHGQGRLAEAEKARRAACQLDPGNAGANAALADSLVARGAVLASQKALVRASRLDPTDARLLSRCLHGRHLLPAQTPAVLRRLHRSWQTRFGTPLPPRPSVRPRAGRPLVVGFLLTGFGHTQVARALLPLLQHRDPTRLRTALFIDHAFEDSLTLRLCDEADACETVAGLNDRAVAQGIRTASVDILVDLCGHGPGNRLPVFARHRPAPMSASWVGYPGTTGLLAIDILLTDAAHVPEDEDSFHTEQVVRLDPGAICPQPPDAAPDPGPPPMKRAGFPTFGTFATPWELSDACLDLWQPVLSLMPTARLLLLSPHWTGPLVANRLHRSLRSRGIDPARIIVASDTAGVGGRGDSSAISRLAQVDVVLDSAPASNWMGAVDAVTVGVPLVTLPGPTVASRHAASVLVQTGRPEGIAASADDMAACVQRALTQPRTPVRPDPAPWVEAFTTALEQAFDRIVAEAGPEEDDDSDRLFA